MKTSMTHRAVIVAGIVAGHTRSEVASAAGISERTLRRRLNEPEIVTEIAEARAQLTNELVGQLQQLALQALDEVAQVLVDGSPSSRLAAAKLILNQVAVHRPSLESSRLAAVQALSFELDERMEADLDD